MIITTHVSFLGGGNMARALIQGLLRQGYAASQLRVGEPVESQRLLLQQELGISVSADNQAAIGDAEVVVLAVKPQQLMAVLTELRPTLLQRRPLLLSIAAGVRSADLAACAPGLPIVRAMPNRPALVGAGVAALFATIGVAASARAMAENIMTASGRTVWVSREADLDIVTALSGSGPAYFFLLAEHLAAAAVAQGLDVSTAQFLAAQTLRGAGALAAGTHTMAEEREAVTSKGGTTAAALASFEQGGFGRLVADAMAAATRRSAELAAQFAHTAPTLR